MKKNKSKGCWEQLPYHHISMELTVSVIFSNHVPAGSSPHVWTDMKSQFLKPLADVSLSRSASSTVLVPEGIYKGTDQSRTCLFHSDVSVSVCACTSLTGWGGEGYVQVPSPGVFDAGLHLHVLQWADCVLLPRTGLGWNLYSDLPCCFQLPAEFIKIAGNETNSSSCGSLTCSH